MTDFSSRTSFRLSVSIISSSGLGLALVKNNQWNLQFLSFLVEKDFPKLKSLGVKQVALLWSCVDLDRQYMFNWHENSTGRNTPAKALVCLLANQRIPYNRAVEQSPREFLYSASDWFTLCALFTPNFAQTHLSVGWFQTTMSIALILRSWPLFWYVIHGVLHGLRKANLQWKWAISESFLSVKLTRMSIIYRI